jgi:hypothetical protein
MEKELLTAALTLFGGLVLFIVGQAVVKLLDPCIEFKKFLSEISRDLDVYNEYRHATAEDFKGAANAFRKHAAGIEQHLNSIFHYEYFADLLGLPTEEQLGEACRELLTLSEMYLEAAHSRQEVGKLVFVNVLYRHNRIRELLRIRRICAPMFRESPPDT